MKKIAVNSGGKHCLALSSEGEVFSWGEGEDGKLGHGNRRLVIYSSVTVFFKRVNGINFQLVSN